MPIVFSALVPHPPVLLPNTPVLAREKMSLTLSALSTVEAELVASKPEVLVVISPHASVFKEAFVVYGHPTLASFFEEFGDVETKQVWNGAPEIAAKISHRGVQSGFNIQMIGEERLDHGTSIPLLFLTKNLPAVKVLPIGFSALAPKTHLEFGEHIKEILLTGNERVAVIASADLSHSLNPNSPGIFHPRAKEFDRTIQELLCAKNTVGLTNLNPNLVRAANECGYRAILILLGIIKNMNTTFKVLAYESPFGVGYLTGIFYH